MVIPSLILLSSLFVKSTFAKSDVLYYENISRIINNYCVNCHSASNSNQTGLDLSTYKNVAKNAGKIMDAIESRYMPPFRQVDDGTCGEWKHSWWLPNEDIELVFQWIQQGKKMGNPQKEVPNSRPPTLLKPEEINMEVQMPEPFEQNNNKNDQYRCFIMDGTNSVDKYIEALDIVENNTHHVGIFTLSNAESLAKAQLLDKEHEGLGYDCETTNADGFTKRGKLVSLNAATIAFWTPSMGAFRFPHKSGFKWTAGTPIIIQNHYSKSSPNLVNSKPQQSRVRFRLKDTVEHELHTYRPSHYNLNIPPLKETNGQDVVQTAVSDANLLFEGLTSANKVWISTFIPHMHKLGVTIKLERVRNGEATCLSRVDDWDFTWQSLYFAKNAVDIVKGDKLRVTCTYRNTTDKTVRYGIGTDDEMCSNIIGVSYGSAPPK